MKHVVMTALAVTLFSGTSALAQEGMLGRLVREAQSNQNQSQRAAPPQRESRPQQAAPSRESAPAQAQAQSRGDGGRRGGQPPLAGGAQPSQQQQGQQQRGQQQRGQQQQGQQQRGQQQQGAWQGQRRPDGQGAAPQGRPGAQANGGQGRGQGANGQQGQGRPDGQYNLREDEGPLARAYRESQRGYDNNNRPGWNNNDRGNYDRRPVIRPEDRRDRDRNRPRYDQRRFPHYVTSQQRYRWYGPVWRAPVGFYSFRWQWGQTLPWSWYTPDYYLNDYWRYGLPMPPIGCEWVRVGDDAILVDVFNGRIYQVVYNLFW